MNVAVLSLTRDRLEYTKHCFASLRANAGIPFDHYVLDNGSKDGTVDWLNREAVRSARGTFLFGAEGRNIGVHPGLNVLLDAVALRDIDYDVIVNFDNDCEVLVPDTLKVVCEIALAHPGSAIGPQCRGLRAPPRVVRETEVDGHRVGIVDGNIGGIMLPLPAGYRFDETAPLWGNADGTICANARRRGHTVGYLLDYPVNHYETTDGQHERFPEYFERRVAEGGPD